MERQNYFKMTKNQIYNILAFTLLFHDHNNEELINLNPKYIVEKFNRYINIPINEIKPPQYSNNKKEIKFINSYMDLWKHDKYVYQVMPLILYILYTMTNTQIKYFFNKFKKYIIDDLEKINKNNDYEWGLHPNLRDYLEIIIHNYNDPRYIKLLLITDNI